MHGNRALEKRQHRAVDPEAKGIAGAPLGRPSVIGAGMMAENRTGLVVGASRGLGLGLAAELKSRGWHVVATVRDQAGERRLRGLAAKPGGEIIVERVDINDDAEITGLRRRLDGRLFDLVFVNAGIAL